jgi:23S rRNA pseudouridine2605 synthase
MYKAIGHPVSKLKRVGIGPISDPKLTPGVWRELTKQEVKMLATLQEPKPVKPRRVAAKRPAVRKKPASSTTSGKAKAKSRGSAARRG